MPLQELEHILGSVPLLARPLLEPHLLELEAKLRPGTLYLTWASMNIDGYLHYAQKVLQRLSPFTLCCCIPLRSVSPAIYRPSAKCVTEASMPILKVPK